MEEEGKERKEKEKPGVILTSMRKKDDKAKSEFFLKMLSTAQRDLWIVCGYVCANRYSTAKGTVRFRYVGRFFLRWGLGYKRKEI